MGRRRVQTGAHSSQSLPPLYPFANAVDTGEVAAGDEGSPEWWKAAQVTLPPNAAVLPLCYVRVAADASAIPVVGCCGCCSMGVGAHLRACSPSGRDSDAVVTEAFIEHYSVSARVVTDTARDLTLAEWVSTLRPTHLEVVQHCGDRFHPSDTACLARQRIGVGTREGESLAMNCTRGPTDSNGSVLGQTGAAAGATAAGGIVAAVVLPVTVAVITCGVGAVAAIGLVTARAVTTSSSRRHCSDPAVSGRNVCVSLEDNSRHALLRSDIRLPSVLKVKPGTRLETLRAQVAVALALPLSEMERITAYTPNRDTALTFGDARREEDRGGAWHNLVSEESMSLLGCSVSLRVHLRRRRHQREPPPWAVQVTERKRSCSVFCGLFTGHTPEDDDRSSPTPTSTPQVRPSVQSLDSLAGSEWNDAPEYSPVDRSPVAARPIVL
eukprot:Hpha_TRINITY_DN4320_c0_g1::TRINITY_DN4320_c0_g1_i1::g.50142::m.50142